MTIHELQRRWKQIDLKKAAASIVAEHKKDIADLNREQLMDGVNKEGKKLRKYRSPKYAARKNRMNPIPGLGNPDLYLTGRFQEAMNVKLNSKTSFEIYSTDSKAPKLTKQYGKEIFGLTEQSKDTAAHEIVNPGLIQYIKDVTKL